MAMDAPFEHDRTEAPEHEAPSWFNRHPKLAMLALLVLAAIVAGGTWYWLTSQNYVTTSDARIAGNVTQMAPMISGRVTKLLFTDNQHVVAGQKLVEIDPRDYQAKLDQALAQQASAQAQLKQAKAQLAVRQAEVAQADANIAVAEADLTQAQKNYYRYQHLNPAAVTQEQRDQVDAAYREATARLDAAQQGAAAARAQVDVATAQLAAAQAAVKQADAAAEYARVQLSYTAIAAPVTGRIGHRTVNVGDVVQPGQPLFAIVQDQVWVEADFKETQLAGMKPGQPATVYVDAVPGHALHGTVNSFQPGTGSEFSALPAENATGNWVKVVQRVPVKITFDGDSYQKYFLAPGMSVEPSVKVR